MWLLCSNFLWVKNINNWIYPVPTSLQCVTVIVDSLYFLLSACFFHSEQGHFKPHSVSTFFLDPTIPRPFSQITNQVREDFPWRSSQTFYGLTRSWEDFFAACFTAGNEKVQVSSWEAPHVHHWAFTAHDPDASSSVSCSFRELWSNPATCLFSCFKNNFKDKVIACCLKYPRCHDEETIIIIHFTCQF